MTKQCFRNLKEKDQIVINENYIDANHKVFKSNGMEYRPNFGNVGDMFYVSNCAEVEKDTFCAIAFKNPSFIGEFIVIYEYFHEWFSLIDEHSKDE